MVKVKITNPVKYSWYRDFEGEVYEVDKLDKDCFRVKNWNSRYIDVNDCEEINGDTVVVIKKANMNTYWYADRVYEVFPVKDHGSCVDLSVSNEDWLCIDRDDATVVKTANVVKTAKQVTPWSSWCGMKASFSNVPCGHPVQSGGVQTRHTFKKDEATVRKQSPVYSGVMSYFPDALIAVSQASFAGQQQHNPNKPLAWDRSKSGDELDALTRHLLEAGTVDSDGIRHSAKVAWRALANLQKELEQADEASRTKGVMVEVLGNCHLPKHYLTFGETYELHRINHDKDTVIVKWGDRSQEINKRDVFFIYS